MEPNKVAPKVIVRPVTPLPSPPPPPQPLPHPQPTPHRLGALKAEETEFIVHFQELSGLSNTPVDPGREAKSSG